MPAFRNVANRHSGRLSKSTPVIYDDDGWETLSPSLQCLDVKSSLIKVEPLDDHPLSPVSPSTASASSPPGSSPSFSETSFSIEPRATSSFSFSSASPAPAPVPAPAPTPAPSRKNSNSHSRRRDPSHIPRPRNAFILFRSDYIKQSLAQGALVDGHGQSQQNELSKHAGKVWNKMSVADKQPYAERAKEEKEEHYRKYPNYVYAPGRTGGSTNNAKARPGKRKTGGAMAGRAPANRKRKAAIVSEEEEEEDSSSPGSPDMSPVPMRPQKTPRVAAQRAVLKFTQPISPSPSPSPSSSPSLLPAIQHSPYSIPGGRFPSEDTEDKVKDEEMAVDLASSPHLFFTGDNLDLDLDLDLDGYVPTSEIPLLELTPTKQEEQEQYTLYTNTLPHFAAAAASPCLDNPFAYTYGYGMNMGLMAYDYDYTSGSSNNVNDPTLPPLPHLGDDDFAEFLNRKTQEEKNMYGMLDDMFPVLPPALGGVGGGAGTSTSSTSQRKAAAATSAISTTGTTTTKPSSSSTPMPASSSRFALAPKIEIDHDPILRWDPSPPPDIFPDFPASSSSSSSSTYPFLDSVGANINDVDAGMYQFFDLEGNHRY